MSDKLDRLVAEKVMGWTHSSDNPWGYPPSSGPWWNVVPQHKWSRYETLHASNVPEFSTDISAAWEVVEHLRKQTKDDGTRKYLLAIIDEIAHVEVRIETVCLEDYHIWSGPHGQEPMGICLAALRAVGVPESEIQEAMR